MAVQDMTDGQPREKLLERWKLTYANSFPSFWTRTFIKTVEWFTAKPHLLRRMKRWESTQDKDPEFWKSCLDEMGIDVQVTEDALQRIPKTGPVIVVCNHPHGLIDGIVLARMLIQRRTDFKILTRALLQGVDEADKNILPVAFPHEPDAVRTNISMRKQAIQILQEGGCIALFPAGTVATSKTFFGPVVEPEWMPFLSKMVRQSDARVLPIYFPGTNSRVFQIANRISTLFRQSLLLYEIRKAFDKPQSPIIGETIERDALTPYIKDPEALMVHLRQETVALGDSV